MNRIGEGIIMKSITLILSKFYRFIASIFKLLFVGINTIFYLFYSIFLHFFIGIWTILKSIFTWPLALFNKNKSKKQDKLKLQQEFQRTFKDELKEAKLYNEKHVGNTNAELQRIQNLELKEAKIRALADKKREEKTTFKDKWNNNTIVKNQRNHKEMKKEVLLMNFEEDDVAKSDKKRTYIYEAKDRDGKYIKGKFDAFSKVDVHSFLLNEGFEVYSIKTSSWINFLYGSSAISTDKYSKKDLIFFLTQLSTYLKSGISLIDSIRIFAKQERKSGKQKILQSIVYELVMGESFSNALDKQGNSFPRLLVNMVRSAEMTGELPETLDDMADYYTTLENTRKQMINAMMYPSIIFIMSVAIMTFIMLFVIPQFVDMYGDLGAEIPWITQLVINISDFLGQNYLFVFIGIALFVTIFIMLYKKIKLFRGIIQYIVMHIPVFGKIIIYSEVTTFTKTFASLLNHNVFITDSMEILSKITNNEIYKAIIYDTMTNLSKGESISVAFKDHWAFPIVAYEMLLTGERTGELGTMMSKVSTFYQEQHSNLVTQMKSFIEPIMIAVLAFLVGGLLLAVVVPMFSMYSQI